MKIFRWIAIIGCIIIVSGIAYYLLQRSGVIVAPNAIKATEANARGIGYMEQFDYGKAAKEFKTAMDLSPNWLPARINYGMALYNNTASAEDPILDRAIKVFNDVLIEDPKNPYAHFNLGVIKKYRGDYDAAAKHFETVTQVDPEDDRSWLYLAQSDPNSQTSGTARQYFETAVKLNPYLNPAWYALAQHSDTSPEEQARLLELFNKLKVANWEDEARPDRYSEQGRYAAAIGRGPAKTTNVGPVPLFAQTPTIEIKLPSADAMNPAFRERHGGVIVQFDHNSDGKLDILLLSASKEGDVLLTNEAGSLIESTQKAGLSGPPSLACAVADYDNDGKPDLVLTHQNGVRLLRNIDGNRFEDKTQAAGLDKLNITCGCVAWIDLDQDGDVDLLLGSNRGLLVFANAGVAPPAKASDPLPPLSTAFSAVKLLDLPTAQATISAIVALDVDGDKDVDLLLLSDGQPPVTVLNDRLMRFRVGANIAEIAERWLGGLVIDLNDDDQSDLLFLTANQAPQRLISLRELPSSQLEKRFLAEKVPGNALKHAHRCDLDFDGKADVVGLSSDGKPVFLQGQGGTAGRLELIAEAFGPAPDKLTGLLAIGVGDINDDCSQDLLAWDAEGFKVFFGKTNGNRGLKLSLTGKRDATNTGTDQKNLRTNTDAIGTKVTSITGPIVSMVELTTLSAGPGQSLKPIELGIGRANQADTVRIRWPDCVVQAELAVPACDRFVIGETNRKPTSCPVLMCWDGSQWVYVTDFLGGGALGELGPDGQVRPSRPEESLLIQPHQLGLKNGKYIIRIAEPMDEVMYLDHVRLDVVDHPLNVHVVPDERFAIGGPAVTQKIQPIKTRIFPERASDQSQADVTELIAQHDQRTVHQFQKRSWLGYAEDHWVELDFGDRLKSLPIDKSVSLILAGWTDYPYPESIAAATQAGIPTLWPVLEKKLPDGRWQTLGTIGLPAGLPKIMSVPVGDWLRSGGQVFRIRTNLQIYWDQIYLGVVEHDSPALLQVHQLAPSQATLSHPGFVQEISPPGHGPIAYNPNRFEPVAVTKWQGMLTRLGDVKELLSQVDDRLTLCGPGDEVTIEFAAKQLPPVPEGWQRSFVLRTHGYCKDTAPTTLTGGHVGPLPHRAMSAYPCHELPVCSSDRIRWHTRPAGRR